MREGDCERTVAAELAINRALRQDARALIVSDRHQLMQQRIDLVSGHRGVKTTSVRLGPAAERHAARLGVGHVDDTMRQHQGAQRLLTATVGRGVDRAVVGLNREQPEITQANDGRRHQQGEQQPRDPIFHALRIDSSPEGL
jgi:hypothetical protein